MTGRVLVVDDVPANLKLIEARLTAEYFDVILADTGRQALALLERERVDVVLLDVMMPGIDGFEVCRRIKGCAATMHIPVIMVTALDQPNDKIQGLEAGADDFLTKPVDDVALLTRMKNLMRVKTLNDEMAMRVASGASFGMSLPDMLKTPDGGRIMVVEDNPRVAHRIAQALQGEHAVETQPDVAAALEALAQGGHDLVLVSLNLKTADGLRLCSQVRSLTATRHLSIVVLVDPGEEAKLLRALDMGVNDYLTRPIDRNELVARVRTQLRRKRYADQLREAIDESVELAATDTLTGLFNRRYLEAHLAAHVERARGGGAPLSLMIADIDHFKAINDTWGHDAGDTVLREVATRLRRDIRAADIACRLGGEEFVVLMPSTDTETANGVAERLRDAIARDAFPVAANLPVAVTLSVGVATISPEDTPKSLLKRADTALYAAKTRGRNRVVLAAA
ncbi:MAG: PleD family two-component system response regulator [Hyphomicrobiaceae bacterium]|nr:PleD family two-component system response regulator [Hyphomicrobiaceae bacterium]